MAQAGNPHKNKDSVAGLARAEQASRARNVFIFTLLIFGAVIATTIHSGGLAFKQNAWQLYVLLVVDVAYLLILCWSIYLSRRGRPDAATLFLVGGMIITGLGSSAVTAHIGLVVGMAMILMIWIAASLSLSQQQFNRTLIAGVGAGAVTTILDLLNLPFQFPAGDFETLVPVLTGLVLVAYGVIVIWQFRSYSLRTKFIAIFLVVSVLAAGAVAVVSNRAASTELTRSVGSKLQNVARLQAAAAGELLARNVDTLEAVSLNKRVQDEVAISNAAYTGTPAEIEERLRTANDLWLNASAGDAILEGRLNPIFNLVIVDLLQVKQNFSERVEIIVTDRYGGLVAATYRTTNYSQANEPWWQAAFNNGQGAVYIGQPELDDASDIEGFSIALPIRKRESTEVIGVLRLMYSLAPLTELLGQARFGETGEAVLIFAGDSPLGLNGSGIIPIQPATVEVIRAAEGIEYLATGYEGVDSLVSQAVVDTVGGDETIAALGWRMVAHQARQEALAPVDELTRNILFLAILIVAVAAGVAIGVAYLLARPILRLTAVARQISAGDLAARAQIDSGDEIGSLAATFNTMADQLRETIDSLEDRVAERTQQLETVVKVSQRLAGILDLSDLLRQVVVTTKETFHYYHVHIYLLDQDRQSLTIAEGYGEAGAEMKRQGHAISLDAARSLVARSAREGRILTVENVREDPNWLPNVLLPETRSEMAVPVLLDQEVVGVLDVQSEHIGGLTLEDEATLQILANQIAVAVRNARLFSETQEALYQAQKLQRLYTGQAWQKLSSVRRTTNYEVRQPSLPPLSKEDLPEAVAAIEQGQTVDMRWPGTITTNGKGLESEQPPAITTGASSDSETDLALSPVKAQAALATPLKLRGQVIGVLGLQTDNPERQWTREEVALIEAVSEQMSLALENARLFEETSRRAGREKVIADMTRQVWASGDLERVMRTAVEQLGVTLDASKVVIRLGTEQNLLIQEEENNPESSDEIPPLLP